MFAQVGLKLYQSLMRFALRIEISLNDFKMLNWAPFLSKVLSCDNPVLPYQSYSSGLFWISKTFRWFSKHSDVSKTFRRFQNIQMFSEHLDGWIEVQFLQNVTSSVSLRAPFAKNTCNQCKNLPVTIPAGDKVISFTFVKGNSNPVWGKIHLLHRKYCILFMNYAFFGVPFLL